MKIGSKINNIIKEFSRYYFQDKHAAISTCEKYEFHLNHFFNYTKKHIEDVKYIDINKYIADLRINGKSVNYRRLAQVSIRMFYRWYSSCFNQEFKDPAINIKIIPEDIKIPKIISPDDIMTMVYEQDQSTFIGLRDAALLCLLADTGIRKGEVVLLKIGNIEMQDENYLLKVPRIKSYERNVPFGQLKENSFVGEYFTAYWSHRIIVDMAKENDPLFITNGPIHKGTSMSARAIEEAIKRASRKAGIKKNVTIHSFRHFYGTYLYINGTDIIQIKKLMGHALLETTQRYIHIADMIRPRFLDTGATSRFEKAPKKSSGFVKIYKQARFKTKK